MLSIAPRVSVPSSFKASSSKRFCSGSRSRVLHKPRVAALANFGSASSHLAKAHRVERIKRKQCAHAQALGLVHH
jgi:hypothetical protein